MSYEHTRLRRTRALAAAATIVALATAASACGRSHGTNSALATPGPAAAWHKVVLCARAHGMPNLPDPQIAANGKAIFPSGLDIPPQTRRACQSLYNRLIPNADHQAPTPAELASLLRFARCMRSHGITDWPDPRPDGTFVPDARISHSLKSTFRPQLMVCERFNPDQRGRLHFNQP